MEMTNIGVLTNTIIDMLNSFESYELHKHGNTCWIDVYDTQSLTRTRVVGKNEIECITSMYNKLNTKKDDKYRDE